MRYIGVKEASAPGWGSSDRAREASWKRCIALLGTELMGKLQGWQQRWQVSGKCKVRRVCKLKGEGKAGSEGGRVSA